MGRSLFQTWRISSSSSPPDPPSTESRIKYFALPTACKRSKRQHLFYVWRRQESFSMWSFSNLFQTMHLPRELTRDYPSESSSFDAKWDYDAQTHASFYPVVSPWQKEKHHLRSNKRSVQNRRQNRLANGESLAFIHKTARPCVCYLKAIPRKWRAGCQTCRFARIRWARNTRKHGGGYLQDL